MVDRILKQETLP